MSVGCSIGAEASRLSLKKSECRHVVTHSRGFRAAVAPCIPRPLQLDMDIAARRKYRKHVERRVLDGTLSVYPPLIFEFGF